MSEATTYTKDKTELAKALVAAQAEMPAVEKTAKANYGNYATLDHLIAKTRPVLNKHGLAFAQFPGVSDLGQPTLVTRLFHESGESIEYEMPLLLPQDKQGMQVLGAALTYARRYALAAALGIASESDDDGASSTSDTPVQQTTNGSSNGQPKFISDAQGKRLWAIAQENNVSADRLKEIVKEITGQDSSKKIPVKNYEEICTLVEAEAIPF